MDRVYDRQCDLISSLIRESIYGNEDPNNEIAWINTSNNITLPKRNTVWDVRVYDQTLIKVFVGRQKANRRLDIRVVKGTPSI